MGIQFIPICSNSSQECGGISEVRRQQVLEDADTPLTTTYRPELDVSRELNVADAAYYQSLIGILRWIVELG